MSPGNGQFSLTAGNPSPSTVNTGSAICNFYPLAVAGTVQSSLLSPSCTVAVGSYTITYPGGSIVNIGFTASRSATVPDGEYSEFTTWGDSFGLPTEGGFKGHLTSNSGLGFGGRLVAETNASGLSVTDGCFFLGSAVLQLTSITGGTWYVQTDNSYGTDWIGFPPGNVAYYQTYRPLSGLSASCTVTAPSQMYIQTAYGQSQPYGSVNTLTISITQTGVTVGRASATGQRAFSF
jgi:hypothetical protein